MMCFPEDVYFDKVTAALSSKSDQYDAFMTGAYMTWTYGPAGWVVDLNEYIKDPAKTNPNFAWDDVLPGLRSSTAWNGVPGGALGSADAKQWCIPWGYELNNLTYNRKMFEKAKVSVPKNLAELSETAAKLTKDLGGPYGIGVRGSRSWVLPLWCRWLLSIVMSRLPMLLHGDGFPGGAGERQSLERDEPGQLDDERIAVFWGDDDGSGRGVRVGHEHDALRFQQGGGVPSRDRHRLAVGGGLDLDDARPGGGEVIDGGLDGRVVARTRRVHDLHGIPEQERWPREPAAARGDEDEAAGERRPGGPVVAQDLVAHEARDVEVAVGPEVLMGPLSPPLLAATNVLSAPVEP